MLNINELKKYNNERKKLKLEPYKVIFEMLCNKIKDTSIVLGKNYCLFTVPEFMLGYSIYDIDDCCTWLTKKLNKIGITNVEIIEKNIMLIIWDQ